MQCTRHLCKNMLASRQAMVFVGNSRLCTPSYGTKVLTSVVLERNLYQTVKKRALEARAKLKKSEYPNSRPCPETTCEAPDEPTKKTNRTNKQNVKSSCARSPPPVCPDPPEPKNPYIKWLIAAAAVAGLGLIGWLLTRPKEEGPKETKVPPKVYGKVPASSSDIPKEVPYLLVGGGTASFSAFRAIKSNDPKAKVLVISDELLKPYMRPPLSKELWFNAVPGGAPKEYRFKQWTGAERSLFFEPEEFFVDPTKLDSSENGGIAIAQGYRVKKIDPEKKIAVLTDGYEIHYKKCLLATGCSPKNLPVFENAPKDVQDKIMFYRTPEDYEQLKRYVDQKKSITVIGSGFLGSELACALAVYSKDSPIKINQIYQESGNMARVLPEYLSKWTTRKIEELGVCVMPNIKVREVLREKNGLRLTLTNGQVVLSDIAVVCVGCEANTDIATLSGLEVDSDTGGFVVNAELEARQNLFVAGDASCFYDPLLGRRRVEHHDHSVVSGRLAGENMVAKNELKKPYEHQSMFWSDLGPGLGYEGIGRTEANLPTVGVFAYATENDTIKGRSQDVKSVQPESTKTENTKTEDTKTQDTKTQDIKPQDTKPQDTKKDEAPKQSREECPGSEADNYGKGVIFYLKNDKIVGILLWNLFNRIGLARTIINQNNSYKDLNEVAKLFEIHS